MANNFVGIYLCAESNIEQYIAELETATTPTVLCLGFEDYEPTPENIERVIEPLCRCISNLRLHNAQHPLRRLHLDLVGAPVPWDENEMVDVFEKILIAAKQFGIFHLELEGAFFLPIQVFVEFCRDNNSLKVLDFKEVSFSSGAAALALTPNNGPPDNSFILTLDKLELGGVSFENSTAATVFANLIAHVNASELSLGSVLASDFPDEEDSDTQITERILSELKMPSAEQLTTFSHCRMENFKAALDAGTTTVTNLHHIEGDEDDNTARLELLASFVRRAAKFNSLTIIRHSSIGQQVSLPPELFQALEACATVMQIHVIRTGSDFIIPGVSPDEVQQLQKITSRNTELDRFATNPGNYPTEELPELMCQFNNCPTGRYMLARRLPEVLSFADLHAMHLSRRRTNPPTPKKAKLQ